jgi:hypothetical protein
VGFDRGEIALVWPKDRWTRMGNDVRGLLGIAMGGRVHIRVRQGLDDIEPDGGVQAASAP